MAQDVLDLHSRVESDLGEPVVQPVRDRQCVGRPIEEVWVGEADVGRVHAHYLGDVGEDALERDRS